MVGQPPPPFRYLYAHLVFLFCMIWQPLLPAEWVTNFRRTVFVVAILSAGIVVLGLGLVLKARVQKPTTGQGEPIGKIRDGYDLATWSRMMPEGAAVRSAKRGFASIGFNFLVRTLLKSKLYDHQCEFKAFGRDALFDRLDQVKDEHWFWDTEILVRAERAGYRVAEFPVRWRPGSATKVDLKRDVVGMGGAILRLWWELNVRNIGISQDT